MVLFAKEIVPVSAQERKRSKSAKKPSPQAIIEIPKKKLPFDIINDNGKATPLTYETANPLFRKKYGGDSKIIRAQRISCEQRAEAADDRAAANNYHREQAEAELSGRKLWVRLRGKIKPEEVETPQKKPRVEPEKEPKEIKDRVIRDAKGCQSVFIRIRYYSALTTKPGVGVRVSRYIFDGAKLRADSGEPYFSSNVADTPMEAVAAFDLAEKVNASTHKNAKLLYHTIIQVPHRLSPEAQMAVGETYAESIYGCHNLPYLVVLHAPSPDGDQRNTHLHILSSLRPMVRTDNFQWSVATMLRSDLDTKDSYFDKRQALANALNEICSICRLDRRYTALKNVERGLPMPPQEHLGRARTAALRRGEYVHRAHTNALKYLEGLVAFRAQKLGQVDVILQQRSQALRAYITRIASEREPISVSVTSVSRAIETTMIDIEAVTQPAKGLETADVPPLIAEQVMPISRAIPMQKMRPIGSIPSISAWPLRAQILIEPVVNSTSLPLSAVPVNTLLASAARLQPAKHLPQRLPEVHIFGQKSLPLAAQSSSEGIEKQRALANVPASLLPSPRVPASHSLPVAMLPTFDPLPAEFAQIASTKPIILQALPAHAASLKISSLSHAGTQHSNFPVIELAVTRPLLPELGPLHASRPLSNIASISTHVMPSALPKSATIPGVSLVAEVEQAMRAAQQRREIQLKNAQIVQTHQADPEPARPAPRQQIEPKSEPQHVAPSSQTASAQERMHPAANFTPPIKIMGAPSPITLPTPLKTDTSGSGSDAGRITLTEAPFNVKPAPSGPSAPTMANPPREITQAEASIFAIVAQHPYYLEPSGTVVSASAPAPLRPKLEEFLRSPRLAETMYEVRNAVTKGGNTLALDVANLIAHQIEVAHTSADHGAARQRHKADDFQQIVECFSENPTVVDFDRYNLKPVSSLAPPFVRDIFRDPQVYLDLADLIERTRRAHVRLRKDRNDKLKVADILEPNNAISNVLDELSDHPEWLVQTKFLGLRCAENASDQFRSNFAQLTDDAHAIFQIQQSLKEFTAEKREVDAMLSSDRSRAKITPATHATRLLAVMSAPNTVRLKEAERTPYQSNTTPAKKPAARKIIQHEYSLGMEHDFGLSIGD